MCIKKDPDVLRAPCAHGVLLLLLGTPLYLECAISARVLYLRWFFRVRPMSVSTGLPSALVRNEILRDHVFPIIICEHQFVR